MQYHSRLARKIWDMANAIREKCAFGKKMSDEDAARVKSLEAIADDHARKAMFQDEFYR